MDILKLVKIPIDEFRKEFEHLNNEKFNKTEDGLNILQWAFLANNINVIKYLYNNYPYDLKKELSASYLKDENFKNVTLATVLPFTYLVRNNPSIENKNALNSKLIDTNAIFAQIEKSIIQKELIKSEQLVTIKKRI